MGLEQSDQGRVERTRTERYQGHYEDSGRHSKRFTTHGLEVGFPIYTFLTLPVCKKYCLTKGEQRGFLSLYTSHNPISGTHSLQDQFPHSPGTEDQSKLGKVKSLAHRLTHRTGVGGGADAGLKGSIAGPALERLRSMVEEKPHKYLPSPHLQLQGHSKAF